MGNQGDLNFSHYLVLKIQFIPVGAFLEIEVNYKYNGKVLSLFEDVFQFFFSCAKDDGNIFPLLKFFHFCQINDLNRW